MWLQKESGFYMNYKLNQASLNIAMLNKGYSISELSKVCGVGKSTISRIIRGQSAFRPSTIYKIANALDLEVEDLIVKE